MNTCRVNTTAITLRTNINNSGSKVTVFRIIKCNHLHGRAFENAPRKCRCSCGERFNGLALFNQLSLLPPPTCILDPPPVRESHYIKKQRALIYHYLMCGGKQRTLSVAYFDHVAAFEVLYL